MSLMEFSAVQLAGKIKKKKCTCREAVERSIPADRGKGRQSFIVISAWIRNVP